MPLTPNPQAYTNRIAATDFDNMTDEQIDALLNGVQKLGGKSATIPPATQPVAKRHVDLDALIEANRG